MCVRAVAAKHSESHNNDVGFILYTMGNANGFTEHLWKRGGKFGIFSLILVIIEQILDREFVCPCEHPYNIIICTLYIVVPSIGCGVLPFYIKKWFPKTERIEKKCKCVSKCLVFILTVTIWPILFFVDGRYLACACSNWGGVYTYDNAMGNVKWCKPTGNETSVLASQQMTLKWISRSQILGFFIFFIDIIIIIVLVCTNHRKCQTAEDSTMELHGRLNEKKCSSEDDITCM